MIYIPTDIPNFLIEESKSFKIEEIGVEKVIYDSVYKELDTATFARLCYKYELEHYMDSLMDSGFVEKMGMNTYDYFNSLCKIIPQLKTKYFRKLFGLATDSKEKKRDMLQDFLDVIFFDFVDPTCTLGERYFKKYYLFIFEQNHLTPFIDVKKRFFLDLSKYKDCNVAGSFEALGLSIFNPNINYFFDISDSSYENALREKKAMFFTMKEIPPSLFVNEEPYVRDRNTYFSDSIDFYDYKSYKIPILKKDLLEKQKHILAHLDNTCGYTNFLNKLLN